MKKAILLLSGGIDSTCLLWELMRKRYDVHCLSFEYDQTLSGEVDLAEHNAVGCHFLRFRVPYKKIAPANPLICGRGIPSDRQFKDINGATPPTYVPFRNGIFLAYAVAYGEARGIDEIYCGGNGLNSGQYYDDTTAFAKKFQTAARQGTAPNYHPKILFPYADMTKRAIVLRAVRACVPLEQIQKYTYSCYVGGATHCGTCDSCRQRARALGRKNVAGE